MNEVPQLRVEHCHVDADGRVHVTGWMTVEGKETHVNLVGTHDWGIRTSNVGVGRLPDELMREYEEAGEQEGSV